MSEPTTPAKQVPASDVTPGMVLLDEQERPLRVVKVIDAGSVLQFVCDSGIVWGVTKGMQVWVPNETEQDTCPDCGRPYSDQDTEACNMVHWWYQFAAWHDEAAAFARAEAARERARLVGVTNGQR